MGSPETFLGLMPASAHGISWHKQPSAALSIIEDSPYHCSAPSVSIGRSHLPGPGTSS